VSRPARSISATLRQYRSVMSPTDQSSRASRPERSAHYPLSRTVIAKQNGTLAIASRALLCPSSFLRRRVVAIRLRDPLELVAIEESSIRGFGPPRD
jgi:hypothetical protein